jgi:hypothetical protein
MSTAIQIKPYEPQYQAEGFQVTPELLAHVNAARSAMGKPEVREVRINHNGFLFCALGMRNLEYIHYGRLFLFSPVEAEQLAKLWGKSVQRQGEYFWSVAASHELLIADSEWWRLQADENKRASIEMVANLNVMTQRATAKLKGEYR